MGIVAGLDQVDMADSIRDITLIKLHMQRFVVHAKLADIYGHYFVHAA